MQCTRFTPRRGTEAYPADHLGMILWHTEGRSPLGTRQREALVRQRRGILPPRLPCTMTPISPPQLMSQLTLGFTSLLTNLHLHGSMVTILGELTLLGSSTSSFE